MTLSWVPVQSTDIIGSIMALYLAVACLVQAWRWFQSKPDDIFRHYIFILTTAIVIFAISRSAGHLVKQILVLSSHKHIWDLISPFSGAINTTTFIAIFTIGLYYQRVKKVHYQLKQYNDHLEDLIAKRTKSLEETNTILEDEIIERKQIQLALKEEKECLAVTLRSIGDGVITTDMTGRILLINKVTEQLTGWQQKEAAGRPISEVFNIVNELNGESRPNPVSKVLESGQIVALANHTALIARDGTKRSIADSGAPILDQDSKIIGVVLVFRDVTSENKLRAELMKAEKLESVGVLAGGIAHDFNNILMAIMGNLSLVKHFLDPGEKKVSPLILAAEKASLRAKDLTQQLLTFSRGGDPVKETAAVGEIIRDSADFVLHGSNIKCQYSIADDLWMVNIDKGQMSQVIQNLIINARQAMGDIGNIKISGKNISNPRVENFSALDHEGKYIKVSIDDNGPGIPSKALHKIFDPYFTTKEMGSGLGLAITNSIIAKHDGFIRVDSSPKGTTFAIYLPVAGQTKHSKKMPPPTYPILANQKHCKILVMDDEKMVREVTKSMLTLAGYEVVLAKEGREALSLFQKAQKTDTPIAAVIMDLTIPGGMGGKETAEELLLLEPTAKILVSSGYSNDPILANYRQYGFCGAIVKPYQMSELQKALAAIF